MNIIVITTNIRFKRTMVLFGEYFNEKSKAIQNNIADMKLAVRSPLSTMKNAPQKLPPM